MTSATDASRLLYNTVSRGVEPQAAGLRRPLGSGPVAKILRLQPAEHGFQQRGDAAQLPPMGGGESGERLLTGGGEREEGAAPVVRVRAAHEISPAHQPVDQA